jgi:hypothetical protein
VSAETSQLPLEQRFTAHQGAFANRASTMFPALITPTADTIVVFMNYWKIKNGIDNVACFVRLYESSSRLVSRQSLAVTDDHNEISLGKLLGTDSFEGLAEIEVIADRNFAFAFPAVVAFYRSGDAYSAVHSVGRVRNSDEPRAPARSTETNWTCKFSAETTPFVTLFNGPRAGALGDVVIGVHDRYGRRVAERSADFGLTAPFASKILKLDEVFDVRQFDNDHFFSVNLPDDDFFPRLVVGNFHRDIDFVEATHSFYWSRLGGDVVQPPEADLLSFIPAPNVPELDLELVFFPTNAASTVTATVREQRAGGSLGETGEQKTWVTGGPGAELWRYQVKPEAQLISFDFRNQQLPARLNTSYRYSVRGSNRRFCTDIATGAHAHVYPPKHSHWGHGLISSDYETVVMIRNIAHHTAQARDATATLSVYDGTGAVQTRKISVASESATAVYLGDMIKPGEGMKTISWFLKAAENHSDLEAYWISFAPHGGICGEHAF